VQSLNPPIGPIAAASAVLIRDNEVLMVKRGQEPNRGLWSFPGGKIRAGERAADAVLRELAEETGVAAEVKELITVLDIIARDAVRVQYHYLLVVMRCAWQAGEPAAADDAAEARWIPIAQLRQGCYPLTDTILPILDRLADPSQQLDAEIPRAPTPAGSNKH